MMVANLAVPMIISRLGEMTSSFLFLAFVGNFLPGSLGYTSFAWAFISLSTVVGIGFFSTLMIDVAGENKVSDEKITDILNAGIRLACILGGIIVLGVLCYLFFYSDDSESISYPSGIVMFLMSLSIPAIYLQIVVFNYFNALGQPRFELIFIWCFNIVFIMMSSVSVKMNLNISIVNFVLAYISLRWVLVLVFFVLLKIKRNELTFKVSTLYWDDYRRFLLGGVPLALCFGGESLLYFVFSIIAKSMGDVEISAYQASLHFLSIIYMISIGIGNSTAILTTKPFKENRLSTVKAKFFEGVALGAILLAPCIVVCIYFSDSVAGIYSSDVEVRKLIGENIKIAVPFILFEFIYVVVRMVLRSLGDTWVPTALTIFCLNGLGLSLVWIFFESYHCDIKYLFWSLSICTFVLMVFLVWRLISLILPANSRHATK